MSHYKFKALLPTFISLVIKRPLERLTLSEYRSYAAWKPLLESRLTSVNLCLYGSLIPLLWILIDILFDNLGANPIQALHIRLGDWSLRFLCITLLITPIQKVTRWPRMANYRQLFGLYTFLYATLHLLGYLLVDQALVWSVIYIDILESTYIWFGLIAYIILLLLALTSSKGAKKWMGRNWKKLHRFIYIASIATILHYFLQLKGNLLEPIFYTLVIFILLAFRVAVWLKDRQFNRLMIPKSKPINDE